MVWFYLVLFVWFVSSLIILAWLWGETKDGKPRSVLGLIFEAFLLGPVLLIFFMTRNSK